MSFDEQPPDHGGPPAAEGYPAPELLSDAPDARADLYSLGGVLYEFLTGSGANTGRPARAARASIQVAPRRPPGLDKLILSMLAADREDRPPSAQAVLDELRSIEKTADLESLISSGESARLEFKQTMQWDTELHRRNPELLRACVKTVCAFLNGEGGILLIGVANSGKPAGLEDDIRDFTDRKTIDGFESRFRDALVAGLDPESSHLVTVSFPVVRGFKSAALTSSVHPILSSWSARTSRSKSTYGKKEPCRSRSGVPPAESSFTRRSSTCARGTRHDRWMSEGLTSTSAITGDNPGGRATRPRATASCTDLTSVLDLRIPPPTWHPHHIPARTSRCLRP